MTREWARWVRAVAVIVCLVSSSEAHADGDHALGPTLHERATGLGLVSAGVGLSGRFEDGTVAPLTTATIALEGVPSGAVIRHAYLYWQVYGTELDASVNLDGVAVEGTLIGTGGGTCWEVVGDFDLTEQPNVTYRADVTDRITGDGDYVLTGFPSGEAMRDSQGASLVVIFVDPSESLLGTVALRDGCAIVSPDGGVLALTFDELDPITPLAGRLHMGVGDGQSAGVDGSMSFASGPVPLPSDHFNEFANGRWWSDGVYELSAARLAAIRPGARFQHLYASDCLAFAYLAVFLQSDEPAPPDAGVDGGPDELDGGAIDGGGIDVGGPAATGGCGCRSSGPSAGGVWASVLGLVLVVRAARRRAGR